MSRNPRYRLPPTEKPVQMELRNQEFARRLYKALVEKGWSQSDLARRAFGTKTDERGYKVAKGRDRISVYLRGAGYPEPRTLQKIAKVLRMSVEDLAPEIHSATIDRERPEVMIHQAAGHSDKVHLVVNKIVPYLVATKVMDLINEADNATGSG